MEEMTTLMENAHNEVTYRVLGVVLFCIPTYGCALFLFFIFLFRNKCRQKEEMEKEIKTLKENLKLAESKSSNEPNDNSGSLRDVKLSSCALRQYHI